MASPCELQPELSRLFEIGAEALNLNMAEVWRFEVDD
jgi:hypothetical protein